MNVYDITLTIITIIVFIFLLLAPLLSTGIQNIKNNWVEYRCNPVVMPFAGIFGEDPTGNFTFCIHSMIKDFIGFLLEPIHQVLNVINSLGSGFKTALNDVRTVMAAIRNFITQIIQTVFGVFLNILIEIQKLIIRMVDTLGKFLGILTALLYVMDGSMMTMQSAWNGPPGQLVRALCFDPSTKIRLNDGIIKSLDELKLGDKLKNGEIVEGIIQLNNMDTEGNIREKFYKFNGGENETPIYVTGSHMVFNGKKYVKVKDHPDAIETDESNQLLYCLRTSKHHIAIGDYLFWDWDDDDIVNL